jgi:hypothetical protein
LNKLIASWKIDNFYSISIELNTTGRIFRVESNVQFFEESRVPHPNICKNKFLHRKQTHFDESVLAEVDSRLKFTTGTKIVSKSSFSRRYLGCAKVRAK